MGRIVRGFDPLGQTPRAITNLYSAAGWDNNPGYVTVKTPTAHKNCGVSASLCGALTANTLATMLSVSGPGVINFMGATMVDAVARTIRMKLTLDGVAVFDSTCASEAVADYGGYVVGGLTPDGGATNHGAVFDQIPFKYSCLFEVASSLTETNKFNIYLKYRTN